MKPNIYTVNGYNYLSHCDVAIQINAFLLFLKGFCTLPHKVKLVKYTRLKQKDKHNKHINYESESIKSQPNLFLGQIDLFFFDVIALWNDALGPTVFQCHQPRTEEARVLVYDPLLNCRHDFFVGPEMTSMDILFQV